MDPLVIAAAYIFGLLVSQVGLPPLIGYLAAGFVLNWLGFTGGEALQIFSDLGVTLLLFSIGLKLDVKSLARPEAWAGASIHTLVTVLVFSFAIYGLSLGGVAYFVDLSFATSLLIAFALSFSSTVFAVKILEEKAEMGSIHGRVSINILVMQDIFAVIFLTVSLGKIPSLLALLIPLALWCLRPLLFRLMDRSGHGELLLLFGLFAALVVGAAGFDSVGLKADLGALILGILLAKHPKSSELSKSLMGFKDLLLVGFFLTIGLAGTPNLQSLGISAILVAVLLFKVALFFFILTRFKLRARSALLSSLSLANYSEFGLIVAAVGAAKGWIGPEWLIIIALALSATFVLASPLNTAADALYIRYRMSLIKFETDSRHPEDQPIDPEGATIGILGMGRVGTTAYDFLRDKFGNTVLGIDHNHDKVLKHRVAGRRVLQGDPTDPDFWVRIKKAEGERIMVLLAMPKHQANLAAAKHLVKMGFNGYIIAIAHFDDHVEELKAVGVHAAYNLYSQAGLGFSEHAWEFWQRKSAEKERA